MFYKFVFIYVNLNFVSELASQSISIKLSLNFKKFNKQMKNAMGCLSSLNNELF